MNANEPHGACWLCGEWQPWTKGIGLCNPCWAKWTGADEVRHLYSLVRADKPGRADDPPGYTPPPEYGGEG